MALMTSELPRYCGWAAGGGGTAASASSKRSPQYDLPLLMRSDPSAQFEPQGVGGNIAQRRTGNREGEAVDPRDLVSKLGAIVDPALADRLEDRCLENKPNAPHNDAESKADKADVPADRCKRESGTRYAPQEDAAQLKRVEDECHPREPVHRLGVEQLSNSNCASRMREHPYVEKVRQRNYEE